MVERGGREYYFLGALLHLCCACVGPPTLAQLAGSESGVQLGVRGHLRRAFVRSE